MSIFTRRIIILFAIAVMIYTSNSFAQEVGDYKSPPLPEGDNIWGRQRYFVGMSKDALYKIYPLQTQQNYFKKNNEEWIVFDDILTETDFKDVIAFYLKDGKVTGWDKRTLPKSPEEILKMIIARHGHSIGEPPYVSTDNGAERKRQERRDYMRSQRITQIPASGRY